MSSSSGQLLVEALVTRIEDRLSDLILHRLNEMDSKTRDSIAHDLFGVLRNLDIIDSKVEGKYPLPPVPYQPAPW